MSQTKLIVETLKKELRKQGINYRQVSHKLELSEASVKRLFAENSFTLERVAQVCEMLHLEISEGRKGLVRGVLLLERTPLVSRCGDLVRDRCWRFLATLLQQLLHEV